MSKLTDTLSDSLQTLLASGQQIPALNVRNWGAQVIGAIAILEARARGNEIHYTSGVPGNALGLEGDLGVNKLTGDFFQFTGGQFVFLFSGAGKAGLFTPIKANQFGKHPDFNSQDELNQYLLANQGTGSGATTPPATAKPTITSFLPTQGAPGSTVVLTGTGFAGATLVSINSGAVASFVVDSATKITAVLSSSQTTGKVRVTTPAGTGVSTTDFTVTPTTPGTTPVVGKGYQATYSDTTPSAA